MLQAGTSGVNSYPQGASNGLFGDISDFIGGIGGIVRDLKPIWTDDVITKQNGQPVDDTYRGPNTAPTTGVLGTVGGFQLDTKTILIGAGAVVLLVFLLRK